MIDLLFLLVAGFIICLVAHRLLRTSDATTIHGQVTVEDGEQVVLSVRDQGDGVYVDLETQRSDPRQPGKVWGAFHPVWGPPEVEIEGFHGNRKWDGTPDYDNELDITDL